MADWATPTLKECPWWRDDMTPEEYEIEREYCYKNFDTSEKMVKYGIKTIKHFAVDCRVLFLCLFLGGSL